MITVQNTGCGVGWLSQGAVLQADISTRPTIAAYSLNLHCSAYSVREVVRAPCGFLCVHYQVKGKDASQASNFPLLRGTYISGVHNDATTSEVRLQRRLTARARTLYLPLSSTSPQGKHRNSSPKPDTLFSFISGSNVNLKRVSNFFESSVTLRVYSLTAVLGIIYLNTGNPQVCCRV